MRKNNFSFIRFGVVVLVTAYGSSTLALDLNQASVEALQGISGVGPKMAQRIVSERARGLFESLEHLSERVNGIGNKRIERFKAAGLTVNRSGHQSAQSTTQAITKPIKALKSNKQSSQVKLETLNAIAITPEIWLIDHAPTKP